MVSFVENPLKIVWGSGSLILGHLHRPVQAQGAVLEDAVDAAAAAVLVAAAVAACPLHPCLLQVTWPPLVGDEGMCQKNISPKNGMSTMIIIEHPIFSNQDAPVLT